MLNTPRIIVEEERKRQRQRIDTHLILQFVYNYSRTLLAWVVYSLGTTNKKKQNYEHIISFKTKKSFIKTHKFHY